MLRDRVKICFIRNNDTSVHHSLQDRFEKKEEKEQISGEFLLVFYHPQSCWLFGSRTENSVHHKGRDIMERVLLQTLSRILTHQAAILQRCIAVYSVLLVKTVKGM